MDRHVLDYFKESAAGEAHGEAYHKVIPLHEEDLPYERVQELVPKMPRGWFELCRLPVEDRIEFTKSYWLSKLTFFPEFASAIGAFFENVGDIGIFLTQKFDEPFVAHFVYGLKGGGGFYQGAIPIDDEEVFYLANQFPGIIFPQDYIAFLEIHNGFAKPGDSGVVPSHRVKELHDELIALFEMSDPILTWEKQSVDPTKLFPFYESFAALSYQCFWDDWHPDQEMGNVYFSQEPRIFSDTRNSKSASETMAFPSFIEWLIFYLERVA